MARICRDCAKSKGGVWPTGHLGTINHVECLFCQEDKDCADTRDWGLWSQFSTKDNRWHAGPIQRKEPGNASA